MNTQSLKILVADDDNPYCVLLKKSLSGRGHSVEVCHSGEDTLERLQKDSFDILLLDYRMEGTNGINVLQWIFNKKIDIPVILITAYGTTEVLEEAYKWGALDHFIKGEMDTIRLPVMIDQVYNRFTARKSGMK
jgi:DNA-binding NtrC family response regulator